MAVRLTAEAPAAGNADQSLPDPTLSARAWLAGLLALAAGVAIVMNWRKWTGSPFSPPSGSFSFTLFAAFYAAAQIIERLMELVVPILPVVLPASMAGDPAAARAAQVKADRAKIALGVAAVLGVAASCGFGLFFLQTIGIASPSNTVDALATGVLIAAGTKPLHDFISLLQNKDTPSTGTGVQT